MGFSGALGRQLTLNADTVARADVADLLDALEQSASEGGIVLHATGIVLGGDLPFPFRTDPRPLSLFYRDGAYRGADGRFHSRRGLFNLAAAGDLVLTITARLGHLTGYEHPQPTLRPLELPVLPMFPGGRPAEFPELHANAPMRLRGEHIRPGAWLVVDGRRVEGSVRCETGSLPDCEDDIAVVRLARLPDDAGLHLLTGMRLAVMPAHSTRPSRASTGPPGTGASGGGDSESVLSVTRMVVPVPRPSLSG